MLAWMPDSLKFLDAEDRTNTLLECAIAASAAERFRLKEGRWPTNLEELVQAKLLAAVPEDVYADKPLRLRVAADGIVIHSRTGSGEYLGDAARSAR